MFLVTLRCLSVLAPVGRPGTSDVIPLSGISDLSIDSTHFSVSSFLVLHYSPVALSVCPFSAYSPFSWRFLFVCFFFRKVSIYILLKLSDFIFLGLAPAEQLASGMCCCMALVFAIMHYIFLVVLMFLSIHLLLSPSPSQPLNKSDIKKLVRRVNETMS